jgi:hypothetical protein
MPTATHHYHRPGRRVVGSAAIAGHKTIISCRECLSNLPAIPAAGQPEPVPPSTVWPAGRGVSRAKTGLAVRGGGTRSARRSRNSQGERSMTPCCPEPATLRLRPGPPHWPRLWRGSASAGEAEAEDAAAEILPQLRLDVRRDRPLAEAASGEPAFQPGRASGDRRPRLHGGCDGRPGRGGRLLSDGRRPGMTGASGGDRRGGTDVPTPLEGRVASAQSFQRTVPATTVFPGTLWRSRRGSPDPACGRRRRGVAAACSRGCRSR